MDHFHVYSVSIFAGNIPVCILHLRYHIDFVISFSSMMKAKDTEPDLGNEKEYGGEWNFGGATLEDIR